MTINGGKAVLHQTCIGTLLSLLLLGLITAYFVLKVDVLLGKKDVDILSAVNESFLADSHPFGTKQGLAFAVGVWERPMLDPRYASINFYRYSWTVDDLKMELLKSHLCTDDELGLTG